MSATMPTVAEETAAGSEGYSVRPFEAGDESDVVALADRTWGTTPRAWFEWCCRENPYVDHVPLAVVERSGEIRGALPFLAVRVRAGDEQSIALRPGEAASAPGHDGDVIRAVALGWAREFYAAAAVSDRLPTDVDVVTDEAIDANAAAAIGTPPAFFFAASPDAAGHDDESTESEPGGVEPDGEALPWTVGEKRGRRHRIQNTGAFLAKRIPGPPGRAVGAAVSAVSSRVRRLRDRRASFDTTPYTVMHHSGVPDATLAACYRASIPSSCHVVYDEAFYDWWYSRPDIGPVDTYVVYRGDRVAAGLVAERESAGKPSHRSDNGIDAVTISNAVPVTGDPARPAAMAAGLERLLDEHADADVVRSPDLMLPKSVLGAYGFGRGDTLPTSLFVDGSEPAMGTAPVVEGETRVGNHPFREAEPFLWPLA